MHIIIGLITAVAGLFWALNSLERSGFRLSSLNPFHWHRRTQWKKQYAENPLYSIDNPMESAAAVLIGIAKLEGEISREQKQEILSIFSEEFSLGEEEAKSLFASTSFLLQSETNFIQNIDKIFSQSKGQFSGEQVDSTVSLLKRIAGLDSDVSKQQSEVIDLVSAVFQSNVKNEGKW